MEQFQSLFTTTVDWVKAAIRMLPLIQSIDDEIYTKLLLESHDVVIDRKSQIEHLTMEFILIGKRVDAIRKTNGYICEAIKSLVYFIDDGILLNEDKVQLLSELVSVIVDIFDRTAMKDYIDISTCVNELTTMIEKGETICQHKRNIFIDDLRKIQSYGMGTK